MLGWSGLAVEGRFQSDAGQLATGAEGGQLGDGEDLAIGGGVGDDLQFVGHGHGLFQKDRFQLGPGRERPLHRRTS